MLIRPKEIIFVAPEIFLISTIIEVWGELKILNAFKRNPNEPCIKIVNGYFP